MYFEATAEFETEVKGKIKTTRVQYLVDAVTPTETEAKVIKFLTAQGEHDFKVTVTKESKFNAVVA